MAAPPPITAPLKGGLHRRPLPAPAIAFASAEGREIFREALADGTAEIFYPLIEQFHTQAEPAFCGLATLVMVLNALNVDPGTMWKGPWRWYHEQALSCCKDPEDIAQDGIEWEEWLCLARCQGLAVDAVRADEDGASLATFEAKIASVSEQPGGQVFVISYSRKAVGQSGDGHYSPIGAYHRGRSLALVLDTARFKYPPHWLPVEKLWEALLLQDSGTCRSRGYAVLTRADVCGVGLFALKATVSPWQTLDRWLTEELPVLIDGDQAIAETEVWTFARSLPPAVASLVSETSSAAGNSPKSLEEHDAVLEALRRTAAYRALDAASQARPSQAIPASKESLALLVILLGRMGLLDKALPHAQQVGLWESSKAQRKRSEAGEVIQHELIEDELEDELAFLKMQAENLLADSRSGRVCCDQGSCFKPCCP
mmetsp:Transcript_105440/g.308272  ORF Transcript_105440/g.308272 Transcript_105440/m.308272 type:complete len:428 (+) Transcript_105440:86-1369(+)